jgi:23S rRNA (pseudouridine1915-N3)-methyltransferase
VYRIDILAVGKVRENYLAAGIREYQKRLVPYARVDISEVRDEGGTSQKMVPARKKEILRLEGEALRGKIPPGAHVIALDRKGKTFTSEEFSRYLEELAGKGVSRLTFLIGGSVGLEGRLLLESHLALSFSALTFPHQLFRLLLLEQLYRAFTIMQGHPYHK